MLSVGAIHFEELAERVGQGEVGGYTALPDSAWWRLQLPIEKPWVNDRWAICLLSCTNRHRKRSFHLVGTGRRALTIECSLMSGCVQGHEPTENVSIKP